MPEAKKMDHENYPKRLRKLSRAQLHFIVRDASEALAAMPDGENTGYYQDEILYAQAELQRQERSMSRGRVGQLERELRQVKITFGGIMEWMCEHHPDMYNSCCNARAVLGMEEVRV